MIDCAECRGCGMLPDDAGAYYQCPTCDGTGEIIALPGGPDPDRDTAIENMATAADVVVHSLDAHRLARSADPETSKAAAESIESEGAALKRKILAIFLSNPEGLTAQEAAKELGIPYAQVWKRVSDLKNDGQVEDSGKRRENTSGRSAIVWRTSTEGARQVRMF